MNDMQDNELDDLFRKSLTNPDIPFDPDAWKAMESKLDAEDRRRTPYFWISAGVVAGIFLLAGSVFFVHQKNMLPVTQANGGHGGVPAEQLPIASADNTSADQTDLSVHTETNNNDNNSNNIEKENTNNSINVHGIAQKISQEADASFTKKSHTVASNSTTAAAASQASRTKSSYTKNKTVKTNNAQAEKYNAGQKYAGASDQQQHNANNSTDTNNNSSTHTDMGKPVRADAAADMNGAQQAGTINQKYVSGNEKSDETHAADKNNLVEKNGVTGIIATDALVEHANLASNNKNGNTHTDAATTTTTNNNKTEADANNVQSSASALSDTTQQQMHSNSNSSNGQYVRAGEYAAAKAPDSLVVATIDPIPAKTDSITRADTSSVKEKKDSYKRGFSMSFILNPEYNSPVDFSFYKPNLNIGLNVEYYILPKISLVSGVIYGQKLYTCDASDYASSPSYVRYGRNYYPEYVKASCAVLDIPINIRYKFLNKETFNVYASTGLSSYIMLKETYIFQYSNKYHRPDDTYQIHNKNRYLFNIWNISVGVEKRISDKWSVQAEPYVKLPLNGVGAGDIKLVSTGIYFSLKYYFK